MKLETESKRLAKLVKLGSTLPSIEELERRIEKALTELENKDDRIAVSVNSFQNFRRWGPLNKRLTNLEVTNKR